MSRPPIPPGPGSLPDEREIPMLRLDAAPTEGLDVVAPGKPLLLTTHIFFFNLWFSIPSYVRFSWNIHGIAR